jgi:hypothetical protein
MDITNKKSHFLFYLIPLIFIIYFFNNKNYSKFNGNSNHRFLIEKGEEEESKGEVLHLIKFNFTTKHNPKESEDPFTYLLLNDVRIPINLGTPNQTILASLRFNDYPFFLTSPLVKLQNGEKDDNIFYNNTSSSYSYITKESLFYKSILSEGEKANETFYFNESENNSIIVKNFTFYYATKIGYNQSGGIVGLCLENNNMNIHPGMNFLTQLKMQKAISYKTFFFNFNNKNKEEGELIIGAYPHEYWKEKYKFDNYLDIKGYAETTFVIYGFIFDEIEIGENKMVLNTSSRYEGNKKAMTADLKFEFGFILAPSSLEENITKEFVDLYKCNSYISNHQEIYGSKLFIGEGYKYYICDNNYNISKKITFLSKEMENIFELDENDLFMTYGNKKYFNIVFLNNGYTIKNWILGKPFFSKYNWIFDPDKKRFGLYKEKINNKEEIENNSNQINLKMIIILISVILIFLIVLGIFIYQYFIRKFRKVRTNEITEEYDYSNVNIN